MLQIPNRVTMPCTEGRLARFLKWTIHRPSSVTATVLSETRMTTGLLDDDRLLLSAGLAGA
jgi:hypothetical protein